MAESMEESLGGEDGQLRDVSQRSMKDVAHSQSST